MKIYVAGRTTDLGNVVPIAESLKEEGHEITFEWWGPDGEIRSDLRSEDLELVQDSAIFDRGVVEPDQWKSTIRHKPTGECATGEGHSKVAAHDVAVNLLRAKLNAGWRENPERARKLAERELQAVDEADAVVLIWAPDILGAAIETGAALFAAFLGHHKYTYVFRPGRDSVFWYLEGATQVNTKTELLESIKSVEELEEI